MANRQTNRVGNIFKIPLKEGYFAFGKILNKGQSCVYDLRLTEEEYNMITDLKEITNRVVLFHLAFFKDIITRGIYEVIGNEKVTQEEENRIPNKFSQDVFNLLDCSIFSNEQPSIIKATPEECIDLERMVVYDYMTLIERIEHFYENKPYEEVEEWKVKIPPKGYQAGEQFKIFGNPLSGLKDNFKAPQIT